MSGSFHDSLPSLWWPGCCRGVSGRESPVRFERKCFVGLKYEVTSPVFGLRRPEGASDEVIVDELERQAVEILGAMEQKGVPFFG